MCCHSLEPDNASEGTYRRISRHAAVYAVTLCTKLELISGSETGLPLSRLYGAACLATPQPSPTHSSGDSEHGIIEHHRGQITIRLARRTYSPVLRQASLPDTITVPWRQGQTLRYQYD